MTEEGSIRILPTSAIFDGPGQGYRAAGLVVLAVSLLHLFCTNSTFQYDDLHSIVGNAHIRDLTNLPRFFTRSDMFSENPWGGMYRPLVLVAHAANWAMADGGPGPFRVLNALLHGANGGLVTLLLGAVGGSAAVAVFGGLAFGLLPVNAEVVYYFSSRSESLCTLFLMASFVLYVLGSRTGKARWSWTATSVASFGLSLLSKEVGIVLPALLIAWEISRRFGRAPAGQLARAICRTQWPYWLVSGVYLVGIHGHIARATVGDPVRSYGVQLATQTKAWVYYLLLLCQPSSLSVEHQFRLADSWPSTWPALLAGLVLASILFLCLRVPCRLPARFGVLWAGLALLPTSLVPLNVLVNEHRLYLPSVAFAGLLAWAAGDLWARMRRAGPVVSIGLLLVYGALSAQRSAAWADPGLLWADAVDRASLMPRPHLFLGDHYLRQGMHAQALEEYGRAETVYPEALSTGDRLQLHNNRGAALLAMGRFTEAVGEYQRALRIDSTYARSREALEGLLALTGAERNPDAKALHRRGLAAMVAGHLPEAVDHLQASLRVQSWPETWLSLGMAFERLGQPEEARQAYASLALAGRGTSYERTARERLQALEPSR